MIEIKRHRWLPTLKKRWEELCKGNPLMSPNQQYDFVLNEWKDYYMYCYWQKMFPEFWEVIKDGKTVMIAPLCKVKNGTYKIFGRVNGCGVCDFIYKDETLIKECLFNEGGLFRILNRDVFLSRIKLDSPLYSVLAEFKSDCKMIEHVRIPFVEDYHSYYNTLHKSVRQNLRTSYNRVLKDGMNIKLIVLYNNSLIVSDFEPSINGERTYFSRELTKDNQKEYFNRMMSVYMSRHHKRYQVETGSLKKWYLLHLNFTTKNLKKLPNSCNVMLFINENLAAFMGGFFNIGENEILVPRLSIDDNFLFYSPGMLLVNETIRFLISETPCRILDLSEGVESYKLKMGGEVYQTAEFWVRKSSI